MNEFEKSLIYTLSRIRISGKEWDEVFSKSFDLEKLKHAPKDFFRTLNLSPKHHEKLVTAWDDKALRNKEFESAKKLGIEILTINDELFPTLLKETINPPRVLFTRGDQSTLNQLSVAIVGPRASTSYGRDVTTKIVNVLSLYANVVSGMALGIDSIAHQKTIEANGKTVGVAGCGLAVDYPQGNRALRDLISQNGCLVSAYPPEMPAHRGHFPERNGIIAGLCQITIVVEASEKSGSLITARLAGEMGRDVAAVPGDITRRNSKGANRLIADGAQIITDVDEVLLLLEPYAKDSFSQKKGTEDNGDGEDSDLPELWRLLVQHLEHEPLTMDQLMKELEPAGHDRGSTSQAILEMEISGLIKQEAGGKYRRG